MKEGTVNNSEDNLSAQMLSGIRGPRDGTITDLDAAKLLLDAWKFRQAHAWSVIMRYYLAAASVSVIPYILKEELIELLKDVLWIFPVLGGLMALAAVWLYAAEYVRAQSMNTGFKGLLEKYKYYVDEKWEKKEDLGAKEDSKEKKERQDLKTILYEKILHRKIGWVTVYILGAASILLAAINFIIVQHIVAQWRTHHTIWGWSSYFF